MTMSIARDTIGRCAGRTGNPALAMPNLMASSFVSEQTGSDSVDAHLDFAERHGYVPYIELSGRTSYAASNDSGVEWDLHTTLLSLAAQLSPRLRWKVEQTQEGSIARIRRSLITPFGTLTELKHHDRETLLTEHVQKLIRDSDDLKGMEWLIRESVRAVVAHRGEVRERMVADLVPLVAGIRGRGLSVLHFWTPATEVLYPFFDQVEMIYAMHDRGPWLRELMEEVMEFTSLMVEIGGEAQVDALQTAIWGYEQWSPMIYGEFVLPYAVPLGREIRRRGVLFWIHTCGFMKGLLEQRIYDSFDGIDILECLNEPPAGDVADWNVSRGFVPEGTITKGNLEDSLLWGGSPAEIRQETLKILRQSEKYSHILGTSNNVFAGTPLANFEAMMSAVGEYNGS